MLIHRSNLKYLTAGAAIGGTYLLLILIGAQIWSDVPSEISVNVWELETDTSPLRCSTSAPDFPPLIGANTFIFGGNSPKTFRIEIENPPTMKETAFYIGPIVDRVQIVACGPDDRAFWQQQLGSHFPQSQLAIPHPRTIFQLTPDVASSVLMMRVEQNSPTSIPFSAAPLDTFLEIHERQYRIKLFLYGAVLMIILYNLSLSFVLRSGVPLFNALTAGSMLILDTAVTGFGLIYLWPDSPFIQDTVLLMGLAGASFFGPQFISRFLGRSKGEPGARNYLYNYWMVAAALFLIMRLMGVTEWIVTGGLVTVWIILAIVILCDLLRLAIGGDERAAILLVPFLSAIAPPMFIGATREYLGWNYGAVGHHHAQIALVMEAVLFTLAIAYLFRLAQAAELRALRDLNRISNQMGNRLVEAIDSERTRISRDLHDSAGQSFVLIASQLGRLKENEQLTPKIRDEIAKISKVVISVLNDLRRTTHDMYPAALDHLGLEKALSQQIVDVEAASGISISFDFSMPEDAINNEQAAQVFRIVQELLSNAAKHSGADRAEIKVRSNGSMFSLTASDNGRWKEATSHAPSRGIGLSILEKRVEMLGGTIKFRSTSDATEVVIEFPIALTVTGKNREN